MIKFIFPAVLIIMALFAVSISESNYTECEISQEFFKEKNSSEVTISFKTDFRVDSFKTGPISYQSSCKTGTIEEDASWIESNYEVSGHSISTSFIKNESAVSETIKCHYLHFWDCEKSPVVYIPVTVYSGINVKQMTLRAYLQNIHTKVM